MVMGSVQDQTGTRGVELMGEAGGLPRVEGRRGPGNGQNWRRLGPVRGGFATEAAALRAAVSEIAWLAAS